MKRLFRRHIRRVLYLEPTQRGEADVVSLLLAVLAFVFIVAALGRK